MLLERFWRRNGRRSLFGGVHSMKEGMETMKEGYMNLLSGRDHILMVSEMYHCAFKKEEEESERLTNKLEITNDLLKITQRSLHQSKLQI